MPQGKLTDAQKRRLQKLKYELFWEQNKKAQTRGYKTKSGDQVAPVKNQKAVTLKHKAVKLKHKAKSANQVAPVKKQKAVQVKRKAKK